MSPKSNPTAEVNAQHSKMLSHKVDIPCHVFYPVFFVVVIHLSSFYSHIILYLMSGPHS